MPFDPRVQQEEKISLRLDDAVAGSGLSRSTLYNPINSGKLRNVTVGGRRLILRDDLEALIHSGIKPAS